MKMKERILGLDLLPDQIGIFYLGQLGFIIKYRDTYTMIDGYLTDYLDTHFSTPTLKWERLYPGPMDPNELDFLDYVFCTHPHGDHTDPQTLLPASKCPKTKFFAPESWANDLVQYGIPKDRVVGVFTDTDYPLSYGVKVRPIPAAHEELHKIGENSYVEVGYVFTFGSVTLYHSGDCCIYDGLDQHIGKTDIMISPINGRDYYRLKRDDIIGNFDSFEAITLAKEVQAKLLIPAHFGLYSVNTVNPAVFIDILAKECSDLPFHMFSPGDAYIYDEKLFKNR